MARRQLDRTAFLGLILLAGCSSSTNAGSSGGTGAHGASESGDGTGSTRSDSGAGLAPSGSGAGSSNGGAGTTGNGGTTGSNGGATGAAASGAGASSAGTGGASGGKIPVGSTQCSDGKDNDGDGLIDSADPECTGPLDNDEGSFATGIPGDNVDPKWQDCFFDGNSGGGDDGCRYSTDCLTGKLAPTDKNCAVTDACRKFCMPLTPNGCDCFGCCAVSRPDGSVTHVEIASSCTYADVDDPKKCPVCIPSPSCENTCGHCQLCVGKSTLPADCTSTGGAGGAPSGGSGGTSNASGGAPGSGGAGGTCAAPVCAAGQQSCGVACLPSCPADEYCLTGCCVPVIR
jgi:hypothetical protein